MPTTLLRFTCLPTDARNGTATLCAGSQWLRLTGRHVYISYLSSTRSLHSHSSRLSLLIALIKMFKLSRWLRSSKQQVLPTTTDLELQNEDGRNASDLPRQDHPFDTSLTCPSNHSALNAAVSKVRKTVNKKRLPNCIFLCIGSKSYGPHVIRVPCRRSSKLSDTDVPDSPIKDDQDVATFQRLREAYFVSQGRWKKWLPFYDAVEVREINVCTLHTQSSMSLTRRSSVLRT